jgi:hypothetical protein
VQSDVIAALMSTSAPHRDVAGAFDEAMRGWMTKYGVQRGSIAVMHNDRLAYATLDMVAGGERNVFPSGACRRRSLP